MSENDTPMETIAPLGKEETTKDLVSSKLTNGDNAPKSPTVNGKSTENDDIEAKHEELESDKSETSEEAIKTKDKLEDVETDNIEKKNGDGESNHSDDAPEKSDDSSKEVKDEDKESAKDDTTEEAKTNGKESLDNDVDESAEITGTESTANEDGAEDSDSPKKKPKKKPPVLDDTPTRRSSRARKPVSYVDEVKIVPEAKSTPTKGSSQEDVVVIDGEKKNVIVIDTNTLMRNQGNLSMMVGQKTPTTTNNTQSPLQQLNQQLISNSITLTQHPSSSVVVTKSGASSTPPAQTNTPKTLTPQQLLQSAIHNVSTISSSANLGGINQTAAAIANNPAALQNAIAAITGGGNAPPGLKNAYLTAVQQVLIQQQSAASNNTPTGQAFLNNIQQYYNTVGALQDEAYVIEAPSFIVPYVMEGKPKESIKDFLKKMNAEASKEEKKSNEEKQETNKEKEVKKDDEVKENNKENKESKSEAEEESKAEEKVSDKQENEKEIEKETEEKMDVDGEEKLKDKTEEKEREADGEELKKTESESSEKEESETKDKEEEVKKDKDDEKKENEEDEIKEKEEDEVKEKEEGDEDIKSKKIDDSDDKMETDNDKSEEKEKMDVDEDKEKEEDGDEKEKKDDEEEDKKDKYEAKEYSDTEDMTKDDYTHLGRWEGYYKSTLGQFMMDLGLSQAREFIQADLLKMQKRKLDKMKTAPSRQDVNAVKSLDRQLSKSRAKNAHLKLETKVCKFCNYRTDSKLVMDRHLESPHMVNYTYKCNYCIFETRGPQVILFHMEAEHMVRGRLERAPAFFQCQLCPFEDNNKSKMTRHSFSCAKKFKPERNCDLSDWEPPAKIPKQMTRGRNIPMASNSNLKNMMANMGNSLYEGAARNLLPKGLPSNLNLQQLQAAVAQGLLPSPASANAANSGNRGRPIGSYKANLVGGNNATSRTGPFNKAGGSLTQAQQLALAGQLFQNVQGNKGKGGSTPSISITPLPRAGATSGGKVPTSKDGKPSFVICEICDGYIKDLEQLRNHMNFIHKVKIHPKMIYNRPPLNCQKCQQRFFTDQGLERHLLGTHGLVTSSMQEAANKSKDAGRCPICGKVFQWKLLNHVARDHKMTLKPAHLSYKCTVCTATFNMYRLFENHVYSAHSVVNKNKESSKTNGSSDVPLKINDEITIIPQPSGNKSMQRFSEKKDTSSITAGVNKEITITKVGSTSVSRNGSSKSSVEVISLDESPQKRGLKRSSDSNGSIMAGPSKKARD